MEKLQGILTICRKAGKMSLGLSPCVEAVKRGRAKGVLVCSDISEKSGKEAQFQAKRAKIPLLAMPYTRKELGQFIGMEAGVLAICDNGFWVRVRELLNGELSGTKEESDYGEKDEIK